MEKIKRYLPLHLNILLFSFTGVFSKAASICYNRDGLKSTGLYIFLFLMLLNCFIYAIAWQKVIKHFDLNVAYANKSIYLIWSQLWAVVIFHETLSWHNILGLLIVFIGVLVVQRYENPASEKEEMTS
ncbi:MAG: EamA family transporter [Blautia sp.]|jgi:small multidrug resistance pump